MVWWLHGLQLRIEMATNYTTRTEPSATPWTERTGVTTLYDNERNYLWSAETLPWQLALPWQYDGVTISTSWTERTKP